MKTPSIAIAVAVITLTACGPERTESLGTTEEALCGDPAPDAVLFWNTAAVSSIVTVAKRPPPLAMIELSIVQGAVHDAVNAAERARYKSYASRPTVAGSASPEAATAAAAHDVLVALYPTQAATLDAAYANALAGILDGADKTNGIAVGQQAASAMLALRANDGRFGPSAYTPGSDPGAWVPTPPDFSAALLPWVKSVTPFFLASPSQFRAPAPPALDSQQYADDYDEVKTYGAKDSTVRTPEQTDIAKFWLDHPGQQLNAAMRDMVTSKSIGLLGAARLLMTGNMAVADAYIGCWDSKFTYNRWRPVTAIQQGDTDGNDATGADTAWMPLGGKHPLLPVFNFTPNHPEYPAAHGCTSAAWAHVLKRYFGTNKITFSVTSTATGATHTFTRATDSMHEVNNARVWDGIHFRTSVEQGNAIGEAVVDQIDEHYFKPRKH